MEPPQVAVLDQVDIARYAGLMGEAPADVPAWFDDQLRDHLLETSVRHLPRTPHPPTARTCHANSSGRPLCSRTRCLHGGGFAAQLVLID